jgi:hypothetical protein
MKTVELPYSMALIGPFFRLSSLGIDIMVAKL